MGTEGAGVPDHRPTKNPPWHHALGAFALHSCLEPARLPHLLRIRAGDVDPDPNPNGEPRCLGRRRGSIYVQNGIRGAEAADIVYP